MSQAIVQLDYPNGESFQTVAGLSGGFGDLPCPKNGETGWLAFITRSNAFSVTKGGASGWRFASVTSASCNTSTLSHNSVLPAPVVFEHLVTVRKAAYTQLHRVRGLIVVQIEAGVENRLYSQANDRITISDAHVYGQFGGFVHAHEYGHALHSAAFTHGNPGSGKCNNPHQVGVPNTAGCAYSEGWADFFSVVTLPTETPGLKPADFELNSWVLQYPTQGLYIEGAVAAYYLDMWDGVDVGESDNQDLNGIFVADVISSCDHVYLGPPFDVGGLRFCFDRNLTPTTSYRLVPTIPYPPQWQLGPMQQDYQWNVAANR